MAEYKNPGIIKFKAKIEQSNTMGAAAWVIFPHSVEKLYGVKGRVPVQATFDGIPYRGSMVKMGTKEHLLLLLKDIRAKLGKKRGDSVAVTVKLDDQKRVITLPADLKRAVAKNKKAQAFWKTLSFTHQREYFKWIEEAKQPETRKRRIEGCVELLAKGKKGRY